MDDEHLETYDVWPADEPPQFGANGAMICERYAVRSAEEAVRRWGMYLIKSTQPDRRVYVRKSKDPHRPADLYLAILSSSVSVEKVEGGAQ